MQPLIRIVVWFKYFVGFVCLVAVALVSVAGCATQSKPQKQTTSAVQQSTRPGPKPSKPTSASPEMKAANEQTFATFSATEQQTLQRLAGSGAVVLVENNADPVPAVHLMAMVNAPADRVAAWLANPTHYRRHMPAVDEVQVDGTHARSTAYGWQWRLGGAGLRGRATVTVLSDTRVAPAARTYLVDHRHTSGDLGVGRAVWRISPSTSGTAQSRVMLSMRTDLRAGNYWIAELATKSKSFSRSTSIAMAVFMMMGLRNGVNESLVGSGATRVHSSTRKPNADLKTHTEANTKTDAKTNTKAFTLGDDLIAALRLGDIAQTDGIDPPDERNERDKLDGGAPSTRQHVWAAGRMGVGQRKVRAVFESPLRFARAMMHSAMASATTEPVSNDEVLLRWGISIPVLGSAGVMRVTREPGGAMAVVATEGAMRGGAWRFTHSSLPWGEGFVIGHGDFEPAESSWITRQLAGNHPYWLPGLAVASQVLAVRAIRLHLSP